MNAAKCPPNDSLVLQLLIVTDQLSHVVEVSLGVFFAKLGNPGVNLVTEVANPLHKHEVLFEERQCSHFTFFLLHSHREERRRSRIEARYSCDGIVPFNFLRGILMVAARNFTEVSSFLENIGAGSSYSQQILLTRLCSTYGLLATKWDGAGLEFVIVFREIILTVNDRMVNLDDFVGLH